MIIKDISEEDDQLLLQHSSSAPAPFMFWGIDVLPGKPVAVTLPSMFFNNLHITQGTLEGPKSENKKGKARSLVSVKHEGSRSELLICSCRRKRSEMTSLHLRFHGPTHMIFSVKGARGVHLAGYLYNHNPSLPTTTITMDDDGGRIIQQRESSVQSNKTRSVGTAGFNFNILLPFLAEYLKQVPVSIEHEQQLEPQTAGSRKRRWKKANKQLPIVDVVNGEHKGSEKKRKKKKSKKQPQVNGADEGDNVEGEKKRKKKKEKKHLPEVHGAAEAKNVEGEKKRKKKRVAEVDGAAGGDVVEGEKKRKRKRGKKQKPEVDGAEGDCTVLMLL